MQPTILNKADKWTGPVQARARLKGKPYYTEPQHTFKSGRAAVRRGELFAEVKTEARETLKLEAK